MRFFEKEGAGTLEKAPGIYRPEFKQGVPTDSLIRYLVEENEYNIPFFAGYWHGYLVVLKLLLVTDYLGICGINRIVQTIVVVVAALILWRKLSILQCQCWRCICSGGPRQWCFQCNLGLYFMFLFWRL